MRAGRLYTDVSRFPGARLTFQHTAEPADSGSGSQLTVRVWLDGPMSWFWARDRVPRIRALRARGT